MFFLPDYNARDDAKKARAEFARALGAYIDLVALERNNGSGARQAMEAAAEVGDSWVFRRLAEELARSRWSGLTAVGGAARPGRRARACPSSTTWPTSCGSPGRRAPRSTPTCAPARPRCAPRCSPPKAKANEVGERMSIPMSLLGVIFMAILVAPALLRVMGGTT